MSNIETTTDVERYQPDPPQPIEVSMHYVAAKMLLEQPILSGQVNSFCDDQAERIDPAVLDGGWSSGQRKLIEIAMSLANDDHKVSLSDVLDGLGDRYSKTVLDVFAVAMSTITIEILPDDSPSGPRSFVTANLE